MRAYTVLAEDPAFSSSDVIALSPDIQILAEHKSEALRNTVIVARTADAGVPGLLASLRTDRRVIAADRAHPGEGLGHAPNDMGWVNQYNSGLKLLNLPAIWPHTNGVASVSVAVVDNGVNEIDELWDSLDKGVNVITEPPTEDTADESGHGTAIASIISATRNNTAGIAGIAPNVSITPVKACFWNGYLTQCPSSYVVLALQWIEDEIERGRNIAVINMSFRTTSDYVIEALVQRLTLRGVIAVGSAGNGGQRGVVYPAKLFDVVAVSGVLPEGNDLHWDSNYGPEVDVAAPYQTYALDRSGYLTRVEGTSYSAAIISGVAALFKSTATDYESDTASFLDYICCAGGWDKRLGRGVPDTYRSVWTRACRRLDHSFDYRLDILDAQPVAYRFGAVAGNSQYQSRYDVEPFPIRDGDIDIRDLQMILGRWLAQCPV